MSRSRNSFFVRFPVKFDRVRVSRFNPATSDKKVECTVTSPDQFLEVMNRMVRIRLYDDGHFEVFSNTK